MKFTLYTSNFDFFFLHFEFIINMFLVHKKDISNTHIFNYIQNKVLDESLGPF